MSEFHANNSLPLSDDSRGHHHGNFYQYYQFHNSLSRYSILLNNTFYNLWESLSKPSTFYLLDIGCNEGNLTIELYNLIKLQLPSYIQCMIIGIDLDNNLINKAKEKYSSFSNEIIFLTLDCMIPHAIENIMKEHNIIKFSLVTAFSITMWIHMNHGDNGLIYFFNLMFDITNGGILIEPQKWISYRKAIQRCRRMKISELPHYQDITIRDIEAYAEEYYQLNQNMKLLWRVPCEEWGREALLFIKSNPERVVMTEEKETTVIGTL